MDSHEVPPPPAQVCIPLRVSEVPDPCATLASPNTNARAPEEKAARREQMNILERWLLWASETILRDRRRRQILLAYLLVLHLLLLLMLGRGGPGEDEAIRGARFAVRGVDSRAGFVP